MMPFLGKSPQTILDAIHAADVPRCFVPEMTRRQRQVQIRYTKESLSQIEEELVQLIKLGKKQKNGEAISQPYERLLKLVKNAQAAIQNLEQRLEAGKMLPKGVTIPSYIFGSVELGVWYFGTEADQKRFESMEQLRQRLQTLLAERGPLREEIKEVRTQLDTVQQALKKQQKAYDRRSKWTYALFIMLVYIVIIAAMFIGAAMTDGVLQLGLIGLGFTLTLFIPALLVNWRRDLRKRRELIQETRQQALELNRQGRLLQQRYTPLNDMCEEVNYEYRDLRATFQ
ncbi:hypothetical protein G4Y79_23025 [Phototrophicus methaneseepsis]|uniref:Uncharacterized protein n=1 Tax=Phototrophicus methaneseepsis TaxID=2710758 RepID=A0A7S8E8W2_9CHLR|nr:hypothetical protein [Phototrophicus methaneseepsis]QPC82524.1 hypothetical protein G4Y79_23025 [Phototrophicus methaneseepsis]